MPKVVVIAQIEDAVRWEAGFRSRSDLFKSLTITTPIRYAITDGNEVAVYSELSGRDGGIESPLKCPPQTESKVRPSREALIFKQYDAGQSSQRKTAIAQNSVTAIDAHMPTETLPVTFQVER